MRNLALFLIAMTVQRHPVSGQGPAPRAFPPATLIAEIPGELDDAAPTLNGRRIYYSTDNRRTRPGHTGLGGVGAAYELWFYDVESKRSTKLPSGGWIEPSSVAAQGNRIAFIRPSEAGGTDRAIWTMPLDPRTGLSAGPARRASVASAKRVAVSPDGKWIAFESLGDRVHLGVIPSDGGTERVLLDSIVRTESIRWSPDQQWIYLSVALPGPPRGYAPTLMRIAFAGGKPEVLAYGQSIIDGGIGLSPDGNFLAVGARGSKPGVYDIALMDVSGKAIAVLPHVDAWLSSSAMLSWWGYRLKPLRSISLVDGKVREVLPAAYDIGAPSWAPDGRSFAVLSRAQPGGSHPDSSKLLIVNADGSNLRAIAVRASQSRPVWSPDGRWIAITERAWFGAQNDLAGLGITAVEVASGRTQRLRTAVSEYIGQVRWAADSKHVLYDHSPWAENPIVFHPVIRRVGLDGSDVVVRAFPSKSAGTGPEFVSDTSVIVSDSSGTFVRSLTSGRFVRVWMGPRRAGVSPRGDLVGVTPAAAVPGDSANRANRTAEILTVAGVQVASVRFPSDLVRVMGGTFLFTPDGKHVLTWGRSEAAKGCCKLYMAPIDGGPVRTIAEFPDAGTPAYELSPDGKTLLFTPSGTTSVQTWWSVDVSGLIRKAPKN